MILLDETPEAFAKRYGITYPCERACPKCAEVQRAVIPFAIPDWRGLMSVEHACGPQYTLKVYVHAVESERAAMRELARDLSEFLKGPDSQ